jgi:UPF0042 nucleotide-binding protein
MDTSDRENKLVAGVPLVIITGLSGAGKSTAMRFLEDLGCYCLDNLPPGLVADFFALYEQGGPPGSGVVIASDIRSGALFDDFTDMVESLRESQIPFEILYLDCSTHTLVRRFKEVRRNHPLQIKQSMLKAIEDERHRLEPIRAIATRIIDTSNLNASDLRETLIRTLISEEKASVVSIDFTSFGFKYGIPRDVDFVFDARFLPNPYYVPELRQLTGKNKEVYNYVMEGSLASAYFEKIVSLISLTLESFFKVGKTSLTVGIGCTGGHHRSVAFATRLADHFEKQGHRSRAAHRDISKSSS